MTLFQVFPYWDEDHTHAIAIDTFGKRAPSSQQLRSTGPAFPCGLQHGWLLCES